MLSAITLVAAIVNGALGYGFSSITVPLALLSFSNRVLNPALVLVEVPLNVFVLFVNRKAIGRVWPRLRTVLAGLALGILAGSRLLHRVSPAWLKLATYATLLPLLFLQLCGIRRPLRIEGPAGAGVGAGTGLLYSLTTISGPPIALLFSNDGLVQEEFRAALAIVRIFESLLTALTYGALGLVTGESLSLLPWIVPSVALGVPVGAILIRRIDADAFRRACMGFDVAIVAFGLSRTLREAHLASAAATTSLALAAIALDAVFLYQSFASRRAALRG